MSAWFRAVAVVFTLWRLASLACATERVMVVIPAPSRAGGEAAAWAPFNYGVTVRVHGKASLAGFAEDLKLARLLVFEAG